MQVHSVHLHAPDAEQKKKLRRLGDDLVAAGLSLSGGSSIDAATGDGWTRRQAVPQVLRQYRASPHRPAP